MNIKSLLLGSAAAMATVSAAQAADAVIVEPEPVEYVRVCDAYGSGFFYIPGTETCLKFNGYVRSTYSHVTEERSTQGVAGSTETQRDRWRTRARFQIDARNETDWGTLRSFIRLQGNSTPNAPFGAVSVAKAFITLGGFRLGLDNHYWNTNHGFGWVNASEAGQFFNSAGDGGWYGSAGTDINFDYTWSGDGVSITAGISSDRGLNGGFGPRPNAPIIGNFDDDTIDAYAGINYAGDGWGAAFTYVSEEASLADARRNASIARAGDRFGNWHASVNVDLSDFVPGGTIAGQYMSTDEAGASSYVSENFEHLWHVGFQMTPTDNTEFFATYSDGDGDLQEGNVWSVGINWYPVDGLKILASYYSGELTTLNGAAPNTTVEFDSFMVGARRSF